MFVCMMCERKSNGYLVEQNQWIMICIGQGEEAILKTGWEDSYGVRISSNGQNKWYRYLDLCEVIHEVIYVLQALGFPWQDWHWCNLELLILASGTQWVAGSRVESEVWLTFLNIIGTARESNPIHLMPYLPRNVLQTVNNDVNIFTITCTDEIVHVQLLVHKGDRFLLYWIIPTHC